MMTEDAIIIYRKKCFTEEVVLMEFAKITSKGQITIPLSVRKQLGVKDGDKVISYRKGKELF